MTDSTMLEITRLCHDIDSKADLLYSAFAEQAEDAELREFWSRMAGEERVHVAFWDEVISMVELDFLPQLFDDPLGTRGQLQEVQARTDRLLALGRQGPLPVGRTFLHAYRMEFYLLHPAFETLFHYIRTISDEPNPGEQYQEHIVRFVAALRRFGDESDELALVGETLSRLWQENRLLTRQIMEDHLTGALNRRGFFHAVRPMIHLAQRNGLNAGVLMVDLDDFKGVNDQHGHQVGDQVLKEVVRRLKACSRVSDIVGRYGGEEFIVFFSTARREASLGFAEKLRRAVADAPVEGLRVTCSVGVACLKPGQEVEEDLCDLIADADGALLQAKGAGKDRCVLAG